MNATVVAKKASSAPREGGDKRPFQAPSGGIEFSPELVMLADPNGTRAEAIRVLRTHIVAQHVEDGRRGLAICSASEGVGATFTGLNLAIALSQIGLKTLFIDANLRNSDLETYIRSPEAARGLRQHLEGANSSPDERLSVDILDNLSIVFSGGNTPLAQELLSGERFTTLVARCLRDYDVTIVNSPSANTCADGRRISTVVGYSILVAMRHKSYVSDIKTLNAQLIEDGARVVGVVLNEADVS